jgi:peptidoglycan hydrolase CwlO-like protein
MLIATLADISTTNVAIIAASSSIIVAMLSSLINWRGVKEKTEVEADTTLFTAYNDVVQNLQTEVTRLQNALDAIREEMFRCDESNKRLTTEIKHLQICVDRLSINQDKISGFMQIEHLPSQD